MEETRKQTIQPSGATDDEYTRSAESSVLARHKAPSDEYLALKQGAALIEREQSIMRLSGKDPIGMLNAILTNDVPKEDHRGTYATLLNPKGRVQTDLRVLKHGEEVLIFTEPEGAEAARAILGRYAPFSRVKIEDLVENEIPWTVLGLYGPRAAELLGGPELKEHETRAADVGGTTAIAVGVRLPVAGYDLIGPANELLEIRKDLIGADAVPAGFHAYETVRIEAGTPRFGPDITPDNFPAEAGILERAVSFSKGCYPGQETVARMHYRGHPNRSLHRLEIKGPTPPPDTPILQNDKQVGRVTSVAPMPVAGQTLALGYLHRNVKPEIQLKAGKATVSLVQEAVS